MTPGVAVEVYVTDGNEPYTQLADLTAHAYRRYLNVDPDHYSTARVTAGSLQRALMGLPKPSASSPASGAVACAI